MAKIKMKTRAATIGETFESFLNSRKANGVVEKTLQTYRYHFSAMGKHLDMATEIDLLTKGPPETAQTRWIIVHRAVMRNQQSWCGWG